jgi:hypothetical protein
VNPETKQKELEGYQAKNAARKANFDGSPRHREARRLRRAWGGKFGHEDRSSEKFKAMALGTSAEHG